jgi:micrococcal nuclease
VYEYNARVIRIVDGDTVHLEVDLGFDVKRRDSFRLFGINAPEHGTAEGEAATAYLKTLIKVDDVIMLRTRKDKREKYGRYLAQLAVAGIDVNANMIESGHAVAYTP